MLELPMLTEYSIDRTKHTAYVIIFVNLEKAIAKHYKEYNENN